MCADVFEKDMEVDKQSQSSLMGGVVLAMELAGEIASVEDFCVEPVSVVRPEPSHVEVYRKRYQNYLECYRTFIK